MFKVNIEGGEYVVPRVDPDWKAFPLAMDPLSNRFFAGCCGSTISSYDIKNGLFTKRKDVTPQREEHGRRIEKYTIIFIVQFI